MVSTRSSITKKAGVAGDSAKNSRERTPKPAISPKPSIPLKPKNKTFKLEDVNGDWEMKPGHWPKPESLQVLRDLSKEDKASYKKNYFIVNTTEKLIDSILDKKFHGKYEGIPETGWKLVESKYNDQTKGTANKIKFPMSVRGFASKYSKAKLDLKAAVKLVPDKSVRANTCNKLRSEVAVKAGKVRSDQIKARKAKEAKEAAAAAKLAKSTEGESKEVKDTVHGDEEIEDDCDDMET